MHSFDNGNALKAKRDNWNQLMKIFRKIGLPNIISEPEADFILRCEDDYAMRFVTKIYEVLTQRKVQMAVKKPTEGRVAGYAKDTGSWKAKETMRKLDLNEDSDQLTTMRKIASVMDSHEKALQEERSVDPERFSVTTSVGPKSTLAAPKPAQEADEEVPQVRVKEIQVRQLDRNVTHLRASKQMQGNSTMGSPTPRSHRTQPRAVSPSGSHNYEKSFGNNGSPTDRYQSQAQPGVLLAENAISIMNACISRTIGEHNLASWSPELDPYQNLLAAIDLHKEGAELDGMLADTLNEIRMSAQQLAEACIVTPKQFWKVSDLFCAVLMASPYQSETFMAGVEAFEAVGRWVAQREPKSALTLFSDFALFKLSGTITANPHKRLGILRILLAFSPPDALSHLQAIKRLQSAIPELNVFIVCLTILAAHETQMNDALLDLYLYYGTIGLGLPSPKLRAGAMSVFSSLLPQAVDVISDMLPQLSILAEQESWWEIQAHILSVCGNLLDIQSTNQAVGGSREELQAVEMAVDIIKKIFSPLAPRNVRHWGLVSLAPALVYGGTLPRLYLEVLVKEEEEDRLFFLGQGSERDVRKISLPSSTGMPFVLEPITVRWHPVQMAQAIEQTVQNSALDRLEPAQMVVLLACVQSVPEDISGAESLVGPWKTLYASLKDYIFVGFCDPQSCVSATGIMKCFMERSEMHESILKETRFMGILRLLYPEDGSGSQECQNVAEDFLRDVFAFGDVYSNVVVHVIEQFAKNFIAQYEMSNLQSLLKEFISDM
eukprot:CAMPEP_0182419154 /NCGR_PEP_ID=MMETSP1167-20130531/3552_1 /TAXON_ID=2988 /ORGANISM="Mallomonas Sp, Strain CCMP3275" /LENGTH=775 /DNA_ID=CAMNT_0024593809 /DNA_START=304 /DNA_END=2628 /DNA_ORIENTATION=-